MERSDGKRLKLVTGPVTPGTDSLVPIYKDVNTGEVMVFAEGKWRKVIWGDDEQESVQPQTTEPVCEFDRLKKMVKDSQDARANFFRVIDEGMKKQ